MIERDCAITLSAWAVVGSISSSGLRLHHLLEGFLSIEACPHCLLLAVELHDAVLFLECLWKGISADR